MKWAHRDRDKTMITLREIDGGTGLIVVCDVCGRKIDNEQALVVWNGNAESDRNIPFATLCDYQRGCEYVWLKTHPNDKYTTPLGVALFQLLVNSGAKNGKILKEIIDQSELLASL